MSRISKVHSITKSEFDRRVDEIADAIIIQPLESARNKALYEAHQEVVMQVMEEGIRDSSIDHQVVSDFEQIYLVLIGPENEQSQLLSEEEVIDLIERPNVYGIIMYNTDANTTDNLLAIGEEHLRSHIREFHWYNDNNPDLEYTEAIDYLPMLSRVGLYGYTYGYAQRFQYAMQQNHLEYLTIDTLGLHWNQPRGLRPFFIIPHYSTSIKVVDFDEKYPYQVLYSGSHIPVNLEWLTFTYRRTHDSNISRLIPRDNTTLHTIVVYNQTINWNVPDIEQLIELQINFEGESNKMIPLTRYPNLEVLKLKYDSPSDNNRTSLILTQTFSRLKNLRIFHMFGNRLIIYPDIFNRLINVEELKINSGIVVPTISDMPSLEILTINDPQVGELDKILEFAENKPIYVSLSGTLMDRRDELGRDAVITEMINYVDSDIMIRMLAELLSHYSMEDVQSSD